MGRRVAVLLGACALGLAWAGPAAAWTKTDETVTMADGVAVATTLYLPDGAAPPEGWPAVLMGHGLGGSRASTNLLAEQLFVPRGYAVLTWDARGHGASGGLVDIDGPAEVGDVRALFERLAARPDVADARIAGWGISYGGGAILRAAGEGVPFAALEPVQTWSDLYTALLPQNLPKTGIVLGFLASIARPSALVGTVRDAAVSGTSLAALRAMSEARSSRRLLGRVAPPVLWAQGKRDYAFDLDQATAAYRLLRGPKRLYLGNFGHAPSAFPADDFEYLAARQVAWLDRFLKGTPNGIDTGPDVELAPSPFREAGVRRTTGLPRTKPLRYASAAFRRTIGPQGKVAITVPVARTVQTFGAASVRVTATASGRWPQLVAVLSALVPGRGEQVLATGGVPAGSLGRKARTLSIRLSAWSVTVPKGARLRLTLAQTSTAQHPDTPVYVLARPAGRLTVRGVSWSIPVLR